MARQDQVLRYSIEVDGDKGLRAIADGLNGIAEAGGPAGDQAKKLLDQFVKLADSNGFIKTLISEKAALQETGDALALNKLRLADLQKQLDATATPSASLQKSFEKTQATIKTLDAAYNQHQATIAKASNALQAAGVSTTNLDAAQRAVQSSLANVAQEAGTLGGNLGKVATETEHAGEKAKEAGGLFGTLKEHFLEIVSIAGALELALKGIEFGKESLHDAEQVEASLSRVKALAQGAASEFEGFGEAIEKAAKAVNVTSLDAANGLSALTTQGLSAQTAIAALIPTLQLSKIAQIDVGAAAGIVAENLKAFNLPATDAQKVVDELTTASHGAAGGLGAMAAAAAQLAPDAKALGLSFTDTVSILGVLAEHGVDTEKSVRGLQTVFADLQKETSPLRSALRGLGDDSSSFGKAVVALSANTPRARDALDGLDGAVRRVILAFGQAGPDALDAFSANLKQSEGAADRIAKAIDDNLLGSLKRFSNSFGDIGEALAQPVLKPFADELSKLAGQLDAFASSPDFEDIKTAVAEMAAEAAKALDDFIQGIDWKGFAADAKGAILQIKDDLAAVAKSAQTIGAVIGKTGDVVGGAFHAIGTGVSGIVAGAAKASDAIVSLNEKAAALTEGTDAAAKHYEGLHAALQSVGDEAAKQAGGHLRALKDDVVDLAGAGEQAAQSVPKVAPAIDAAGTAAAKTAPALDSTAQSVGVLADAAQTAADVLPLVPNYLDETGNAATIAAPKLEQFNTALVHGGGPLQDAKAALAAASQAFADLTRTAGASPEAIAAASRAVVDASAKLKQLEDDAKGAAGSLKGAFSDLKIASQENLKAAADAAKIAFDKINAGADNTARGLADKQNAFLAYAQKALAASAQLDEGAKASTNAQLESQAAILGVSDALQDLETNSAHSAAATTSDAARQSAAFDSLRQHARSAASSFSGGGGDSSQPPLDEAAKKAGDEIKSAMSEGGESLGNLDGALANTRAGFLAISAAAAKFFDQNLKDAFDLGNDSTGLGFGRAVNALNDAALRTQQQLEADRLALSGLIDEMNSAGAAGTDAFGNIDGSIGQSIGSLEAFKASLENGTTKIGLLGQADLAPLIASIDAAISRTQTLAAAVDSANQKLKDISQEIEDALNPKDETAKENARFKKQVDDLQAAAKEAGKLQDLAFLRALENAKKLHAQNLKDIEDEQKAKAGGGAGKASAGAGAATPGGSSGGGLSNIGGGAGDTHLHIHFDGNVIGANLDKAGEELAGPVLKELKRRQSLSIKPILGGR